PAEIGNSVEAFISSLDETQAGLKKHLKVTPKIEELYLTEGQFEDEVSKFQRIHVEDIEITEEGLDRIKFDTEKVEVREEGFDSLFDAVSEKISEWQAEGLEVVIVLQTETESKKIRNIFTEHGIKDVQIKTGNLASGFVFPEANLVVVTEKEIFGEKKKVKPHQIKDIPSVFITSFSELKPGDYIVHVDFGIGIFRGLKRLKLGNTEGDFLQCEYQGGDKIYVPVDKLKLVQRYVGGKNPRIDKLGHSNWKRVVKRVKKATENIAKDLLRLYAERRAQRGFRFSKRDKAFREFEFSFPYEETPDQEAAIEDVMKDMETPRPMDRLICGDVGFGKTEVALRAAFKAVMDGKQVAFLVPTTLLAYQHYMTFTERLKGNPVFVEMLSRFRTDREQKEIFKKLEDGTIDIIIGTHKLLGGKVKFKDLGLVIIDEEHKFGVSHKEKLRDLKKTVDVLTLSATPIPRTLQLSLTGIRDISLINTPPEGRQSVETYVYQFGRDIIQRAIKRELERGGAVFFIHNRIENIFNIAEEVRKLAPEARIDVTHGRMSEEKLEQSILKFIRGETDVLVTTAIVEAGLDIPRANTLIVNDAHTFGLADLYQLRGRVGRSESKAYAYFLIPSISSLTPDAKRRLKAISEIKELGSGFKLALSDLEIRGAGNIFGTEQSGHIGDVGLELYLEMLDRAIKELKGEETEIEYEPEIKVNLPAFIPDDYISNEAERLLFYKEISAVLSEKELGEIRSELKDRFGEMPEPVLNLLKVVGLKLVMKNLLVERLDIRDGEAVMSFLPKSPLYHRFAPSGKYRIIYENGEELDILGKSLEGLMKSRAMRQRIKQ
ncbi:MAG TPA: transcription-repair coupling factor, partial [Thermodesulfobacteriota bacterium]|nr:transcription-repair coupling factor [Thermodesulfobacteriota bacterium]